MPTIQIRDVPDGAYQTIRRRAREAGLSLQAYMRQQVVEMADEPAARVDALRRLEGYLIEHGGIGATAEEIVADVHASRR